MHIGNVFVLIVLRKIKAMNVNNVNLRTDPKANPSK